MKNSLLRFNDYLYRGCIAISGLSLLTISLIIPWGVFGRYVLGTGSRWPEPTAILLVVVFTCLGAAASYRANAHIAVGLFTNMLHGVPQAACRTLIHLLMGVISLFMLIWGVKLCMTTWNQYNSALPWLRVGLAYMPLPVGAAVTFAFVLEKAWLGDQSARTAIDLPYVQQEEAS